MPVAADKTTTTEITDTRASPPEAMNSLDFSMPTHIAIVATRAATPAAAMMLLGQIRPTSFRRTAGLETTKARIAPASSSPARVSVP